MSHMSPASTVTISAEVLATQIADRTRSVYRLADEYGVKCPSYNEIIQKILLSNNRALAPTRRKTRLAYGNPLAAIAVNTLAAMELSDIIFTRNIGTDDAAGYTLRNGLDTLIAMSRRLTNVLASSSDEIAGINLDRQAPLFQAWPATKCLEQDHKYFDPDGNELS